MQSRSFASDNYSGVHPVVMDALLHANAGHEPSYGADQYTHRLRTRFKDLFGDPTETFLVYNGTGANILGLSALTRSFNSILCAELSHINVDESTGPEKFTGCKLLTVPAANGKLLPGDVETRIIRQGDQHHAQAKVISISQSTEYGTVYTINEIKALSEVAKKYKLYLHMDGSRISNAAAFLNSPLKALTVDAGVDVLSFGGTKNGMMFGEAVLFFNGALSHDVPYIRKHEMQLHSKMRFISAQFEALLSTELWMNNAKHSNSMAQLLARELESIPEVKITQKVESNAVFAIFPERVIQPLQREFYFYVWNARTSEVRLMCSFDTTEEDVRNFVRKLKTLI